MKKRTNSQFLITISIGLALGLMFATPVGVAITGSLVIVITAMTELNPLLIYITIFVVLAAAIYTLATLSMRRLNRG